MKTPDAFWKATTDRLFHEVFISGHPSDSARAMFFKASAEQFKLGFGTDYSDHPLNPFRPQCVDSDAPVS